MFTSRFAEKLRHVFLHSSKDLTTARIGARRLSCRFFTDADFNSIFRYSLQLPGTNDSAHPARKNTPPQILLTSPNSRP
jgi:hypothetical protein